MFTPSIVGIDIYKTYCIKKYGASATSVISSIVIERLIGFVSSLAVVCLLLHFSLRNFNIANSNVVTVLGILMFLLILLMLFILIKYSRNLKRIPMGQHSSWKVATKFDEIIMYLSGLRTDQKELWYYLFISIMEKLCYGSAIYFSAISVDIQQVEYMHFISSAPLLALLERLPVSISAIGVREGLFVALFKPYFLEVTIPLTIALVLRGAEIILMLFCMILWFVTPEGKLFNSQIKHLKKEANGIKPINPEEN